MTNRLFLIALAVIVLGVSTSAEHWPQWRGPLLNGISGEKGLPVKLVHHREHHLEARRARALRRDTDRLGRAHLPQRRRRQLTCRCGPSIARRGTVRWKRPLGGGNRRMMKQQMSSPSPVTDGRTVWVITGTGVLKAFDFEGKELWNRATFSRSTAASACSGATPRRPCCTRTRCTCRCSTACTPTIRRTCCGSTRRRARRVWRVEPADQRALRIA